jgi:hypothetical protein
MLAEKGKAYYYEGVAEFHGSSTKTYQETGEN